MGEARELPLWRETLRGVAKDYRYYELIADTLSADFDCRALVFEDAKGTTLAIQPCFFVEQDLVATAPRATRRIVSALRRVRPRFLRLRLLMAGCPAGEGHPADDDSAILNALAAALPALARAHGAMLVVWKDFPARHRPLLAPSLDGFTRVASMPATRLAFDFSSFDDYLRRRLSHTMRKNLRRKFRALEAAPPLTMTVVNDLGSATDEALALYEQVFVRSPLQFERLNREFLHGLGERMPERVRFFLWRQESRLVAFSLCLINDGVLHDEYLGLDYRVALDLHLYFVTFRDLLTWALAQGLTAYESTPLNYDPKLHLGFDLHPLDLYVAPASPAFTPLVRLVLPWIEPTRSEPLLRRFPNAAEL
jgi:hypothetical protein